MRSLSVSLLALAALALAACDTASEPGLTPVTRAANVAADTLVMVGNRPVPKTGRYTLYSLRDNRVVLSYKEADKAKRAADSVSTKWDVGFSSEAIIVNRTPGSLGASIVVDSTFEALRVAPATGLSEAVKVFGSIYANPQTGLWTYSPQTTSIGGQTVRWGTIAPTPGRTLVVRTADGKYAKLKFVSYYKDAPAPSAVTISTVMNYVTFDYVLQRDGTRAFQ